ncbi:Uma2 family endonuclease [Kitasatospora sp. MAA4]|uniref:Uma2 family endonuclease n=1 Tax=Kitasatospora sp. MAA4 TaxID=3035093 RepID=UPI0024737028|nr:Uma2 family endonuclease [Kitasatospora sp. MAA4]MDH6135426.1 Uma2 family endonuclease [Kitasatospora sp. MAA4]
MLAEEFEELARVAPRAVEGLRLEFLNGRLGVKQQPDGNHGCIMEWLTRSCLRSRPELWLHRQGLKVQAARTGRALPDGALAHADAFVGHGEWADSDEVLMVVEVTSYDSDTNQRDRVEKPRAYAETNIPVYLLIDRDACEITVRSQPGGVRYEWTQTLPFGRTVSLPSPVSVTLDTEPLKNWATATLKA